MHLPEKAGFAMTNPSPETALDEEWLAFAQRHAGNPFLQHDPLYSLNESLIDLIQAEAPAFFTPEQVEFERDLARTAAFGFFHRQAMGVTAKERQPDAQGLSMEERLVRATRSIDETMAVSLSQDGLSEGEIAEYFEQRAKVRTTIEFRQCAYTGWLVSNRQFRAEVAELQTTWGSEVAQHRRFPVYPIWPFFDDGGLNSQEDFRNACFAFYRRWGLDRLVTWDWPVPMEPDLAVGLRRDMEVLSEAGVVLFVPWYLLRGEKLNLQRVVQLGRSTCEAKHLRNWLQVQSEGHDDGKGDVRFEHLLQVYRYHDLVFVRRYGPACRGNVQRLDRALAKSMERNEDTVKQLRLELRRLRLAVMVQPESENREVRVSD
jgi:hypothetical protein